MIKGQDQKTLLKILFSVYFLVLNFPVENNNPLKLIVIMMAYVKVVNHMVTLRSPSNIQVTVSLKWSLSQQCLMHFAICVLIS